MTPKELMYVKRVQRSFRDLFHRNLVIDFPAMNGAEKSEGQKVNESDNPFDTYLNLCLQKYNITNKEFKEMFVIRGRRKGTTPKDVPTKKVNDIVRAVTRYSKWVVKNKYNTLEAATPLNRERSVIYDYAKQRIL